MNSPKADQQQASQSVPSISNMVHAAESSPANAMPVSVSVSATVLRPVHAPSLSPLSQNSVSLQSHSHSQRTTPPPTTPLSQAQQIAKAADAAINADVASRGGTTSPSKTAPQSTDKAQGVLAEGMKTPEMAAAEATTNGSGAATPGDGAPQDIPHEKLAVGGPAGFAGEDLRAIRVLDRKFCI